VYEFPETAVYCVTPKRVLAERLSRQVRRQTCEGQAPETSSLRVLRTEYRVPVVLRTPEFSQCAFGKCEFSPRPLRRVASPRVMSSVASRVAFSVVEASRVPASCASPSVQSVLRQAFSRVAVPRSRPAHAQPPEFSVAYGVTASPPSTAPKCILSSALHTAVRAAKAAKVQRIGQRLAQIA
jgi:hypothetical protein